MAKKPETESFTDVFTRFGQDLKMPSVDIEKIMSHHRKNLEALEKSAKASAAGASSLVAKQREILQDTLSEIANMAQTFREIRGRWWKSRLISPGDPLKLPSGMPAKSLRSCGNRARNRSTYCANAFANRWRKYAKATKTANSASRSAGASWRCLMRAAAYAVVCRVHRILLYETLFV